MQRSLRISFWCQESVLPCHWTVFWQVDKSNISSAEDVDMTLYIFAAWIYPNRSRWLKRKKSSLLRSISRLLYHQHRLGCPGCLEQWKTPCDGGSAPHPTSMSWYPRSKNSRNVFWTHIIKSQWQAGRIICSPSPISVRVLASLTMYRLQIKTFGYCYDISAHRWEYPSPRM